MSVAFRHLVVYEEVTTETSSSMYAANRDNKNGVGKKTKAGSWGASEKP